MHSQIVRPNGPAFLSNVLNFLNMDYKDILTTKLHISQEVAMKITLVVVAFVFHFALWILIYNRPSTQRITGKSVEDKTPLRIAKSELATRIVSTIHATLTTLVSFAMIFYDPIIKLDTPFDFNTWPKFELTSNMATNICLYSFAYFLADVMICTVLFEENGIAFLVHAFIGCAGSGFAAFFQFGHVLVGPLFLWEGSTPFLNFRWMLAEYGYKDSLLFKINGFILVSAFITFRLIFGVPLCLHIIKTLNDEEHQKSLQLWVRVLFSTAFTCTMVLNTVWGWGLTRGFIKTITKSSHKTVKVEKKVD